MCLAFLSYYPSVSLKACLSQPTYTDFEQFVGAKVKDVGAAVTSM